MRRKRESTEAAKNGDLRGGIRITNRVATLESLERFGFVSSSSVGASSELTFGFGSIALEKFGAFYTLEFGGEGIYSEGWRKVCNAHCALDHVFDM